MSTLRLASGAALCLLLTSTAAAQSETSSSKFVGPPNTDIVNAKNAKNVGPSGSDVTATDTVIAIDNRGRAAIFSNGQFVGVTDHLVASNRLKKLIGGEEGDDDPHPEPTPHPIDPSPNPINPVPPPPPPPPAPPPTQPPSPPGCIVGPCPGRMGSNQLGLLTEQLIKPNDIVRNYGALGNGVAAFKINAATMDRLKLRASKGGRP